MPTKSSDITPALRAIGLALADARRVSKLTQTEAADRIGVEVHVVRNWEAGRRCPALVVLPTIAEAYGFKPWDLAQLIFEKIREMG